MATSSSSRNLKGLRFMLDESFPFTDNQKMTGKFRTPTNGALTSFAKESAPNTAPIVFPGRKLFKMSSAVIKQRMVELACKYPNTTKNVHHLFGLFPISFSTSDSGLFCRILE